MILDAPSKRMKHNIHAFRAYTTFITQSQVVLIQDLKFLLIPHDKMLLQRHTLIKGRHIMWPAFLDT